MAAQNRLHCVRVVGIPGTAGELKIKGVAVQIFDGATKNNIPIYEVRASKKRHEKVLQWYEWDLWGKNDQCGPKMPLERNVFLI